MGYWKTIDEADGWDCLYDTQVWVDDNGEETGETRASYDSFYARMPEESIEQAYRRKYE